MKDGGIRWGIATAAGLALAGLGALWGHSFATAEASPAVAGAPPETATSTLAARPGTAPPPGAQDAVLDLSADAHDRTGNSGRTGPPRRAIRRDPAIAENLRIGLVACSLALGLIAAAALVPRLVMSVGKFGSLPGCSVLFPPSLADDLIPSAVPENGPHDHQATSPFGYSCSYLSADNASHSVSLEIDEGVAVRDTVPIFWTSAQRAAHDTLQLEISNYGVVNAIKVGDEGYVIYSSDPSSGSETGYLYYRVNNLFVEISYSYDVGDKNASNLVKAADGSVRLLEQHCRCT
jgi:hypothetical protein